jgi:hypothetical protein
MNVGPSRKKSGKQIFEADSFADTGSGSLLNLKTNGQEKESFTEHGGKVEADP